MKLRSVGILDFKMNYSQFYTPEVADPGFVEVRGCYLLYLHAIRPGKLDLLFCISLLLNLHWMGGIIHICYGVYAWQIYDAIKLKVGMSLLGRR